MIDILMQYGKTFLWSDGYRFAGVAVTMWLLVLSLVFGFMLAHYVDCPCLAEKKYSGCRSGFIPISSVVHRCMYSYWCFILVSIH